MADRDVNVKIKGSQDVDKAAKQSETALGALKDKVVDLGKAFGAFVAAAALGKFFKDSVEEAAAAEVGMRRLGQAVENAGGNFGALKPEMEAVVDRIQRMTTYTDDELRAALTNLITISGNVKGSMSNLALVTDLAAFKNISLEQAANAVGKAMTGNTKELKQLGITTKDSGDALGQLQEKVGGFAAEQAKTFEGAIKRINNQWGDFKEAVGNAILGSGQMGETAGTLADRLGDLAKWVAQNDEAFAALGNGVAIAGEWFLKAVGWIVTTTQKAGIELATLWGSVGPVVQQALGAILQGLGEYLGQNRALLTIFGDTVTTVADGMANTGNKMQREAIRQLGWVRQAHKEAYDELTATTTQGEQTQTDTVKRGGTERTEAVAKELETQRKAREKADAEILKSLKDTAKALEEGIKKQAKETGEAAEAAKAQLLGMLGPTMKGTIESTGAAITTLLAALKGKLPQEEYQALVDKAQAWKTQLNEMLVPADEFAESVKRTLSDYKETAKAAKDLGEKNADNLDRMVGIARAALDFAHAFGLADDEASQLLTSVINIGEGLKKALGGDLTGGVIQIIGGLTNAIASIGSSAAERDRKRIQELNTQALRDNTDALTIGATGQTQGGVTAAIGAVLGGDYERLAQGGGQAAREQVAKARLAFFKNLEDAGVSRGEAEQLIERLGFSEGFASTDATSFFSTLKALQTRLQKLGLGGGSSFDNQLSFLEQELEFDATGDEDADKQRRLEALVGLASSVSPALRRALRGGVGTEQARGAAATNLRSLFALLRPGGPGIDPSDMGSVTRAQFMKLVEMLIPLLGGVPLIGGTTGDSAGASSASVGPGIGGERGVGIGGEPGKGGPDFGLPPIGDTGLLGIGGGSRGVTLPALNTPKFPALVPSIGSGEAAAIGLDDFRRRAASGDSGTPDTVITLESGASLVSVGPVEMRDDGLPPEQVAEKLATHVARVLGHRYTLQRSSLGQST